MAAAMRRGQATRKPKRPNPEPRTPAADNRAAVDSDQHDVFRRELTVIPKKRGRPGTGRDPLVALRLPSELVKRVDDWAKRNGEESRSATIRAFIEAGLLSHSKQIKLYCEQLDALHEKRKTRLANLVATRNRTNEEKQGKKKQAAAIEREIAIEALQCVNMILVYNNARAETVTRLSWNLTAVASGKPPPGMFVLASRHRHRPRDLPLIQQVKATLAAAAYERAVYECVDREGGAEPESLLRIAKEIASEFPDQLIQTGRLEGKTIVEWGRRFRKERFKPEAERSPGGLVYNQMIAIADGNKDRVAKGAHPKKGTFLRKAQALGRLLAH
jgi:metal-responsive CopG/Arc/MetJ family transcriptional regulator